jgi:hypothetical protein
MSYESDPAGLGVGKRYGPLHLGGVGGVTCGANGDYKYVVEVSAEEIAGNAAVALNIADIYGAIVDVKFEVEEGFPALDTLDVFYDGVTILSAPVAVDTVGIVSGTLAASPTVMDDVAKDITIDVSGITAGATTGYVKVIVSAERV